MIENRRRYDSQIYTYAFTITFILYSLSYALFGATEIQTIYHVESLTTGISLLCIGVMMVLALTRKRKLSMNLVFFTLLAVSLYDFVHADGRSIIIFSIVATFASSSVNLKPVLLADITTKLSAMVLVLILYYSKQLQAVTGVRYNSEGVAVLRNTLGFSHYNVLGALVLSIVLELIYLRGKQISFMEIIGLAALVAWVNTIANPRAAMIASAVGIIGATFYKVFPEFNLNRKFLRKLIPCIPAFLSIVSYITAYYFVYGDPKWMLINKFFSDRLNILHTYLTQLQITLFGQALPTYMTSDSIIVDNVYLYTMLQFGAILFGIALIGYTKLLHKAVMRNDFIVMLVVICELLFGLSESTVYFVTINFTLLLLTNHHHDNEEKIDGKDERAL